MTLHSERFPGESQEYRTARDKLLMAEIELRKRIEEVAAMRRQLPLGGAVPVLAIAAIAWLLTSLTRSEWLSLAAMVAVAAVIYLASSRARRVMRTAAEPAT